MAERGYLFISYARADKAFVERLTADLASSGVSFWRDVDNIEPGTSWPQQIDNGIRRALGLIYVASKNSLDSPWIRKELSEILGRSSHLVFPIVLDEAGAQHMPLELKEIQWVDFREDYETGFKRLMEAISRVAEIGEPRTHAREKSKGYVFLSYCDTDGSFVEELRGFLKRRFYAYWDYNESDRDYHGQLFLELENVIRDAAATLSVLSPSWKQSQWAVKEYMFSTEVGTPVFLLRAKDMGPTLVIAGIPYIDFVQNSMSGFKKLERELNRKGL